MLDSLNAQVFIPQAPELKNTIRSIWQVEHLNSSKQEVILPKGVIEVIFDLKENSSVISHLGEQKQQIAESFINGFNTQPIRLLHPDKHILFGVQFNPIAVGYFFKIPGSELVNQLIDASAVDQSLVSIRDQLISVATFEERVSVVSKWTSARAIVLDSRERLLNDFLVNHNFHRLSNKFLTEKLCYSSRQISRKLLQVSGMNTEQMLLYKKYLHAIHSMHQTDLTLNEIAFRSGFSDQSHFIKTFKSFAQMTPGEYIKSKGPLPGHLFEDVR